eukprot:CAMPEP_0202958874 /NCGR_PEP_ID=MMETSP1396-20130829/3149_1 /ASSEMBLY_ACC=CAM_ASM_000872 /TAXON_ID= /ORGANISM="Pseudokeronopsis sp., Strain Brazil" /LENGTH=53 /DNA_ID=CAMNT_0049677171 /DNA_START=1191 /DNA_END=1352 /DNA_ORIENTATION=-
MKKKRASTSGLTSSAYSSSGQITNRNAIPSQKKASHLKSDSRSSNAVTLRKPQ